MTSPADENQKYQPFKKLMYCLLKWFFIIFFSFTAATTLLLGYVFVVATPTLPTLTALINYQPKMPLRILTADKKLIAEFGQERRIITNFQEIPQIAKKAVLAIEDDRFYQHSGIDLIGVLRATIVNLLHGGTTQGASTITMQVARNFYLTSQKTFTRKLYEIILAYKIERTLNKDQILELYMNQIYLGQRSYGFASAAETYFNTPLKNLTLAQASMLAGLPKAPSILNPVVNFNAAKQRQHLVLKRLIHLGWINQKEYKQALEEKIILSYPETKARFPAEYVAEMVRKMMISKYGEEAYIRGFTVITTIDSSLQNSAYQSVRKGILNYEQRHSYRGPEGKITLPRNEIGLPQIIETALKKHPDNGDILAAVVLEVQSNIITVGRITKPQNKLEQLRKENVPRLHRIIIEIPPSNTIEGFSKNCSNMEYILSNNMIRPGSIVRIIQNKEHHWSLTQLPEVQGALIAMEPKDGAIVALVGGFDFSINHYNHISQAWRQAGSCFKPFIYSAALEKGLGPATIIQDAPIFFNAEQTGSKPWSPKNYGGLFEGAITMRQALVKSKNVATVRIMQEIGANYVQDFVTRFGFSADKIPPYLPSALGAGMVTPLQMANAYSIFANGGYRVNPYLIKEIKDNYGRSIWQVKPLQAKKNAPRAISERNAYIIDNMLKDAAQRGTASRSNILGRKDVAGKTGTTNRSHDAWFAGYTHNLVAISWMGYDKPRSLGDRETGGAATLPIWIDFMRQALKNIPEITRLPPSGISIISGELYYTDKTPKNGFVEKIDLQNNI